MLELDATLLLLLARCVLLTFVFCLLFADVDFLGENGIDPLKRPRQIGQYSVYNPVSKAFRDDVHMFDMNLDRYTHVSVVDALEASERFKTDDDTGAEPQHGLDCRALHSHHNSCWNKGEQCHDVFYVGDGHGNLSGEDSALFGGNPAVLQIRHMCGWLEPKGTSVKGLSNSSRAKVTEMLLDVAKNMFITEYALAAAENAYHKLQTKEVQGECTVKGSAEASQLASNSTNSVGKLMKAPGGTSTYTKGDFITNYLTTPVTRENFEIMLQNDIPLPISVIMARPFCTYQMGTAILARGGLELGAYRA